MQHITLLKLLDDIEAELRKLGYLTGEPGKISGITSAFGYGQISFEQWLGRVFLPNAREAVSSGELPPTSQVAVAAVRNLDGVHAADTLLDLLSDFDQRIKRLGRMQGDRSHDD